MNQITDGIIAGIIGGLCVLLLALIQKRKNKQTGEIPIGKEWNRILMVLMFILTVFLPFAGVVLGIIGLIFRSKRKQGMFLLSFAVGVTTMYVLERPDWGLLFGILIAIFFSIYLKKYTTKSIGIAILLFIVFAISYDVVIHTDYFWNTFTYPLGWTHPH